jgi:hypothetical protein
MSDDFGYMTEHFGSYLGQKVTPMACGGRPPRPPRPGYFSRAAGNPAFDADHRCAAVPDPKQAQIPGDGQNETAPQPRYDPAELKFWTCFVV